jgi:hypothetical protein
MRTRLSTWTRPRRRSAIGRWLLPCLLARVLIPIGFMPGNLLAGEFVVRCRPPCSPPMSMHTTATAHTTARGMATTATQT